MKERLNELVSQSKIDVVLRILKQYIDDASYRRDLLLISARFESLSREEGLGLLGRSERRNELAQINLALITYINNLPDDNNLSSLINREIDSYLKRIHGAPKKRSILNYFDDNKESKIKNEIISIRREQENQNQGRYNIAVVGKAGVGKSALVNYLFNEDVVKTGIGKPITSRGFHQIPFEINGIPAMLFDSWGLEVGRADEWLLDLSNELKERDVDKPASSWFHTVLYCIAASGSRIEEFEIKIIKQFLKNKYNVVIVLTKSDLAQEEDIEELKSSIQEYIAKDISFCEVSSVEKKLKSGTTDKFGSTELIKEINKGFWNSITMRLPERCVNIIFRIIDAWESQEIDFVNKYTDNFNAESIHSDVEARSQQLIASLESEVCFRIISLEVEKTIELYETFSKMLDYHQLVKDKKFKFSMYTFNKMEGGYPLETLLISALFLGIPLLFDMPKKEYQKKLKQLISAFATNTKADVKMLEPQFERILKSMLVEQIK
ncbi:MAG: GTPase domain-containing protein [Saprospiraceae bacterium]|nr:GTPase domain-containing protein [Saprospiraceae bacterium]